MTNIVSLSCTNCSSPLQITDDIDRFSCIYCGTEHLVIRGGGIVSLKPAVESLSSEMAISRLKSEISDLQTTRNDFESEIQDISNARDNMASPAEPSALTTVGGGIALFGAILFVSPYIAGQILIQLEKDVSFVSLLCLYCIILWPILPMLLLIHKIFFHKKSKIYIGFLRELEIYKRVKSEQASKRLELIAEKEMQIDEIDREIAQLTRELAFHQDVVKRK